MRSIQSLSGLVAGAMLCSAILSMPAAAAAEAPQMNDTQHDRLVHLVGEWSVTQSEWKSSNAPPVIDHGRATLTLVLGRHLQQSLRIYAVKPFEGLGYIGYDVATAKYFSTWMDVNFTGIILATGEWEPASHSYTFVGSAPDGKGGSSPLREVMHVQDKDHFTYEYYETHDGHEALAIKLEYSRVA